MADDAPEQDLTHNEPPTATSDRGASIVEYALLVALIAVVCIGAVTFFGDATGASLSTSGDSIFLPQQ